MSIQCADDQRSTKSVTRDETEDTTDRTEDGVLWCAGAQES